MPLVYLLLEYAICYGMACDIDQLIAETFIMPFQPIGVSFFSE